MPQVAFYNRQLDQRYPLQFIRIWNLISVGMSRHMDPLDFLGIESTPVGF